LGLDEIEWFLRAVAEEEVRDFRRGMILLLLTAVPKSQLILARSEELQENIWTILVARAKNHNAHAIALRPWGLRLMATNTGWVFPAERVDGPRKSGWYKARDRVLARMSEYSGRQIERFNPHDFRRTARSNTKTIEGRF
jgi:integrase